MKAFRKGDYIEVIRPSSCMQDRAKGVAVILGPEEPGTWPHNVGMRFLHIPNIPEERGELKQWFCNFEVTRRREKIHGRKTCHDSEIERLCGLRIRRISHRRAIAELL